MELRFFSLAGTLVQNRGYEPQRVHRYAFRVKAAFPQKGEANSGCVCSVIDAEALLEKQTRSASKTLPGNE